MHRIHCYPAPYRDEILYSRNARYGDIMRYPRAVDLSIDLFGESTTAVVDLPTHLGHLAEALACNRDPASLLDEANLTVDRLIDRHTLLPYYALTLPADRRARIRREMAGDAASVRLSAGVVSPDSPVVRRLRYCPRCAADQREEHGECYWRRVHQAPGVIICPDHGEWLRESDVVAHRGAADLRGFVPAERAVGETSPYEPEGLRPFRDQCMTIARSTAWLLDHPVEVDVANLQARYHLLLYDRGLVSWKGRLQREKLVQSFAIHWPPPLLDALGCPPDIRGQGESWLQRAVRNASRAHAPVFHLILMAFLGHTVDTFLALPTEPHPFGDGPWPCLNKVGDHHGALRVHDCAVYVGCAGPIGLFRCGDCGFRYGRRGPDRSSDDRTTYTFVEDYGPVWEGMLARVWRDPRCRSAMGKAKSLYVKDKTLLRQARRLGFLHTDPALWRQAERFGLVAPGSDPSCMPDNPTSIPGNMAARRGPRGAKPGDRVRDYRAAWLAFLAKTRRPGTIAMREVDGVYGWLRAHDSPWLEDHPYRHKARPAPTPTRDWRTFDSAWATKIGETARRLRSSQGFPRMVNVTALKEALPEFHLSSRRRRNMPLTVQAFRDAAETYDAYAVRCLWWAAYAYLDEGVHPTRAQLLVRARKNHAGASRNPIIGQTTNAILAMVDATREAHPYPIPTSP